VRRYRLHELVYLIRTPRFLLGFLQGGFIPDIVLYLSYYYTKNERKFLLALITCMFLPALVPIRLAYFWLSNYVSDIVSAFMATGILRMRGIRGQAGWRYLFLIEGLLTLGVGITSFFLMPPGPTQTKTWFRPKGWFNERYVHRYCE
jgi:MFS family permease